MPRAACALVVHPATRGMILSVKRIKPPGVGKWGLPGGLLGHWESPKSAAARELLEETCVFMSKPDARMLYVGPCPTRNRQQILCVTYYAPVWGGVPMTMDEGRVAWKKWSDLCSGPFAEYNNILRVLFEQHLQHKRRASLI